MSRRHNLSFDINQPPKTTILRKKHCRCNSNKNNGCFIPNQQRSSNNIPKNRAQYLFSIWIKFMMFSFAFHVFHILSLKCTIFIEIPKKELLKFPRRILCTYQASKNFFLIRYDKLMMLKKNIGFKGNGVHLYFNEPWSQWKSQTGTGTFCNNQKRNYNSSSYLRRHWKQAGFNFPGLKYFRSLKWTPIPLSVGFALLAYQHYKRVLRRGQPERTYVPEEHLNKDWEVTCYRMIPWKSLSKAWGYINSVNLPIWTRQYVLNWYVKAFNCDISEAFVSDLCHYNNLGEFFRRPLKTGVRPVSQLPLVSPADGTVLHFGKVECGRIEQVKGVNYSLPTFLGPYTWDNCDSKDCTLSEVTSPMSKVNGEEFCTNILKENIGTVLQYCVIYLAPGDYHRFHSPVNWDIKFRRHFGGELLSVNPKVAGWIAGLFCLNERAVYVGKWEHGFFSMTAVGATNVGSINVYGDSDLHTNSRLVKKNTHHDKWFGKPIHFDKGEGVGEFNLGSTIVLLFEAPSSFKFNLEYGQKVRVGQSLSDYKNETTDENNQKTAFHAATENLLN